jgi:serine/threonine protein kinase
MTKSMRHVNLMPLLNCLVSESQVWLVYPFVYYGSCRDILDCIETLNCPNDDDATNNNQRTVDLCDEQKRLCFNEQSLQIIAKSVLNALVYLHQKHVVHRCVCPENIYISQSGHVMLGGLRYAASLIEQGTLLKSRHDYSPHFADYLVYLSPEMLKQVCSLLLAHSLFDNFSKPCI